MPIKSPRTRNKRCFGVIFNPSDPRDLPSVLYKNQVTNTRRVTSIKGMGRYLFITPDKTNAEAPSNIARRKRNVGNLTINPFIQGGYKNSAR
jgi:hypothetical protein